MLARLVSAALAAALAPALPATAAPAAAPHAERSAVTVTVPDSLVEGDRFAVVVRLGRTHGARRVLLQRWSADYPGADRHWETVDKAKVHGRKRTFSTVAGTDDQERYRARVLYTDAKPAMSKAAAATVWHWTPPFGTYYYTEGISPYARSATINGTTYNALASYANEASWEVRYTPGRSCRAVRGVLGVQDKSADGSSAVIRLVADDASTVLTSVPLTPGMAQPFQAELPLPYRLAVQMQNTSPADRPVYPAVGALELLCTGLQD